MSEKYEAYILALTNLARKQKLDEIDAAILRSHGQVLELQAENNRLKKAIEDYGNNPAGFDWAVLERIDQLEAEIEKLQNSALYAENKRLTIRLEEISKMSFRTGRADLLGKRIKEMIRSTFFPNVPCPHCRGLGEIPKTKRQCDECRSFHEYPMGAGGSCDKKKGKTVGVHDVCSAFEWMLPMLECDACGGKIFKQALKGE